MNIIQNNPYRCLGVYANTTLKDRLRNIGKLTAFLKVGKQISFPLDLPDRLGKIKRDTAMVDNAVQQLALPADQLKQAQFWFFNVTPVDEIALNHLTAGNMDMAMSIWEKKDDVSSLQNRIVCTLMQNDYKTAMSYAERLYSSHSADFVETVLGKNHTVTTESIDYDFLDALCSENGSGKILAYLSGLSNHKWEQYVKDKSIKPLIAQLQSAIDEAVAVRGKSPVDRLKAGRKLMKGTKKPLEQLGKFLAKTDLQYQMIADKLGLEILQCSIDYFNGSEAADAAHKVMELQTYALSVVVGNMAKDRCQDNVNILQEIINHLPPVEVFAEDKAIREELQTYCLLPDKIVHAITLLNNTKPHLQSIKNKLGVTNAYYLKLSTQVVGIALHNVIEEVNEIQRISIPTYLKITSIKSTLREAWKATLMMDKFDMESDFKKKRYSKNRSILKDLCEQLQIPTSNDPLFPSYPPSKKATTPQTQSNSTEFQPSTSQSKKIFSKIGRIIEFIKEFFIGGFLAYCITIFIVMIIVTILRIIGAIIDTDIIDTYFFRTYGKIIAYIIGIGIIIVGIIYGIHNRRDIRDIRNNND